MYVLFNYLEANPRVPWEDLRYLFGEIMYGGHITDDWDRRLCRTFLLEYMQAELVTLISKEFVDGLQIRFYYTLPTQPGCIPPPGPIISSERKFLREKNELIR